MTFEEYETQLKTEIAKQIVLMGSIEGSREYAIARYKDVLAVYPDINDFVVREKNERNADD